LLSLPVDELDEMKRMNPKSPMQIQQEEEMRRLIESGENLQDCHNHRTEQRPSGWQQFLQPPVTNLYYC